MNDFKKKNGFGGGFHKKSFGSRGGFGGRFGDKGGFGNRGGFGGRDVEMHSAVCASCGKTCEVPFRPNGKKPIYCKECFAENGGPAASDRGERGDRGFGGERRERFAPHQRNSFTAGAPAATRQDSGMADIKRQIDALSAKLDKVISMISPAAPAAPAEAPKAEAAKAAPAAKKPSTKKKAAPKKK